MIVGAGVAEFVVEWAVPDEAEVEAQIVAVYALESGQTTACHSYVVGSGPVVKVEEAVWDVSEVEIEIVWAVEGDFVEDERGAGCGAEHEPSALSF